MQHQGFIKKIVIRESWFVNSISYCVPSAALRACPELAPKGLGISVRILRLRPQTTDAGQKTEGRGRRTEVRKQGTEENKIA